MGEAGSRLAAEIALVKNKILMGNVRIVLVHETRPEHGGCGFDRFFHVTPPSLVRPPRDLYKTIAVPIHVHPRHIAVALSMIANDLGAVAQRPKSLSKFPASHTGANGCSPMEAVMEGHRGERESERHAEGSEAGPDEQI